MIALPTKPKRRPSARAQKHARQEATTTPSPAAPSATNPSQALPPGACALGALAPPTLTRQAFEPDIQARVIQSVTTPAILATTSGRVFQGAVNSVGYQLYHEQTMKAAGSSNDPVETMLLEQMLMAHHVFGELLVKAADSTPAASLMLYAAATKLMAEYRKGALALQQYRTGAASAAGEHRAPGSCGDGKHSPPAGRNSGSPLPEENEHPTEKQANGHFASNNRIVAFLPKAQPTPRGGRSAKPAKAASAV